MLLLWKISDANVYLLWWIADANAHLLRRITNANAHLLWRLANANAHLLWRLANANAHLLWWIANSARRQAHGFCFIKRYLCVTLFQGSTARTVIFLAGCSDMNHRLAV